MSEDVEASEGAPAAGQREQRRAHLISAGLSLLAESSIGPPLPGVTAAAVAQRAGVSPQLFYRYFSDPSDYLRVLLDHVARQRAYSAVRAFGASLTSGPPRSAMGPDAAAAALADALASYVRTASDRASMRVEMHLWALHDGGSTRPSGTGETADAKGSSDPGTTRTRARSGLADAVDAHLQELYVQKQARTAREIGAFFKANDLSLDRPWTFAALTTLLLALAEGLALRLAVDDDPDLRLGLESHCMLVLRPIMSAALSAGTDTAPSVG